jgi:hypothetical protein
MPRRRRPHAAPETTRRLVARRGRAACLAPMAPAPLSVAALRARIRVRIAELEPLAEELERLRHVLAILDALDDA